MNPHVRQRLAQAVRDVQTREVLTFLYRDQQQGAPCAGLKEMLFLHEDFEESRLEQMVTDGLLVFDGTRYLLSGDGRQVLDRDPTILLDEFLR